MSRARMPRLLMSTSGRRLQSTVQMQMRMRTLLVVLVVSLGCLGLGGCSSRGESQEGSPAGNTPGMTAYDDGLLRPDPPSYLFDDMR